MSILARNGESSSEDEIEINLLGPKKRGENVQWQTLATFANEVDAIAYMSKNNLAARGHRISNKTKNKQSKTWNSQSKTSLYKERIVMVENVAFVVLQNNGIVDINPNLAGVLNQTEAQTAQIDAYRENGRTGGKAILRLWLHEQASQIK